MKRTWIALLLALCCLLVGCKEQTPAADPCEGGHLPGEWTVVLEASTAAPGMKHRVCERCGVTVESEEIPQVESSVPQGPVTPSQPGAGGGSSTPDSPEEPPVLGGDDEPPIELLLSFEVLGDNTLGVRAANLYLTELTVPATYEGKTVTAILPNGFVGCAVLESLTLPSTITEIGEGAFSGCAALEEILLPAGLTRIGASAFAGCNALSTVTDRGCVLLDGVLLSVLQAGTECLTLPDGITHLADGALAAFPALEAICLPDSLLSVGHALHTATALSAVFTNMSATEWAAVAYADALPSGITVYTEGMWSFVQGVPTPIV